MEKFIIALKDDSKRNFLVELLMQLDFIEFKLVEEKESAQELQQEQHHDFFQSAGLFANREIDANQLRKQAWRLPN